MNVHNKKKKMDRAGDVWETADFPEK